MMALIEDRNEPWFGHPMFWAPFVVVGEGALRQLSFAEEQKRIADEFRRKTEEEPPDKEDVRIAKEKRKAEEATQLVSLPKCTGWSGIWNKCHGTRTFHNAPEGRFVGEFRIGNRWNGKMYYSYGGEKGVYINGVYKSL